MDKVVIFGGYEFLGFYLCTAFLDKGNTVQCVPFNNNNDPFLEEKKFTVGRNANFEEVTLADWDQSSQNDGENGIVIISLFDLFIKNDPNKMKECIESVFAQVFTISNQEQKLFIFILPIQFLEIEEQAFLQIRGELEKRKLCMKSIYLPTLYGPWQPMENVFQQTFLSRVKDGEGLQLSENEWLLDAIYIMDAISEIIKIVEDKTIQSCLLKSSVPMHWKKCADFLSIDPNLYEQGINERTISSEITSIVVNESIGYEQGLNQQKSHLIRILSGV